MLALPLEMKPAVEAFLLASTQWRWTAEGRTVVVKGLPVVELVSRRTGLDYAALRDALALAGLELAPQDFTWLRVMEAEALLLMARRARQ